MAIRQLAIHEVRAIARIPGLLPEDGQTTLHYHLELMVNQDPLSYWLRSGLVELASRPQGSHLVHGRMRVETDCRFSPMRELRDWITENYSAQRVRKLLDPRLVHTGGTAKERLLRECFDELMYDLKTIGEEFEKK